MNITTKIVITAGEPAGIGVDICINLPTIKNAELYVIADPDLLTQRSKELKNNISLTLHHDLKNLSINYRSDTLNVIPLQLNTNCITGKLDSRNSEYVLSSLDLACDLCLRKEVSAMVTAPVQKSIINQAGFEFTGHTEYLAKKSSTSKPLRPVMMLATSTLRVALATTHLPLKEVSQAITQASLSECLTILNTFLQNSLNIKKPKILVCGLNPHAGESGNLGDEEIQTIIPVVEKLNKQGMHLIGPLPADTLFTSKYLDHADAVLAMYHDQGLPVLKYSGFGKAVNITLGLPFIRTSVDHGTALDLAGTGKASASSLHEALKMAIEYVRNEK